MNLKKSFLIHCEENNYEINQNQLQIIEILKDFYNEFQNDKIVLEKWFQLQSSYNNSFFDGINSIKSILQDIEKHYEDKN